MFWKIYSGLITVVAVNMVTTLFYIEQRHHKAYAKGFESGANAILDYQQAEKEKAENKPTDKLTT